MKKLISIRAIAALQAYGATVMNSSAALDSQGMTLASGDSASPEVFTSITELSNIDGPGGQATEIDVTDLLSTAKEYRQGLKDEGDVTCDMNYIPQNTQHALLQSDRSGQVLRNYRITFTDSPATTWTFLGFVKGLSISNGVDNVTKGSLTIRVAGDIAVA